MESEHSRGEHGPRVSVLRERRLGPRAWAGDLSTVPGPAGDSARGQSAPQPADKWKGRTALAGI